MVTIHDLHLDHVMGKAANKNHNRGGNVETSGVRPLSAGSAFSPPQPAGGCVESERAVLEDGGRCLEVYPEVVVVQHKNPLLDSFSDRMPETCKWPSDVEREAALSEGPASDLLVAVSVLIRALFQTIKRQLNLMDKLLIDRFIHIRLAYYHKLQYKTCKHLCFPKEDAFEAQSDFFSSFLFHSKLLVQCYSGTDPEKEVPPDRN